MKFKKRENSIFWDWDCTEEDLMSFFIYLKLTNQEPHHIDVLRRIWPEKVRKGYQLAVSDSSDLVRKFMDIMEEHDK